MLKDDIVYLIPYQPSSKTKEVEIYKDIDLSLTAHPLTKDLTRKVNADAIKRSLRHIFMWRKWDIPFNANCHNHLMDILFELNTIFTRAVIQSRSEWLIKNYEPRVEVVQVDVEPNDEESGYNISIIYIIKNVRQEDNLNLFLQRVR